MADEALPEHIGPYRVTGHLGRGGMGEVLRGHDDRLDRPVALKRIHPGGRDPEKARRRFRREARVVARLSHQAIVGVYDWVEAADDDWLVMELVDGRSLDAVLEDGKLPPERAARVAREIASGLAAAHEAGLVHRDLKPANVMVIAGGHSAGDPPDRIKILDFGIAKKVELEAAETEGKARPTTLTEAGQVIGTVNYMSPEQALGYPVDHRSDLFSLGSLFYEMLSGVSPFAGDSQVETLSRICSAREVPLADLDPRLPATLTGLVGRLLEKETARRPAGAREVVAELDRLAADPGAGRPPAAEPAAAGADDVTLEMIAAPVAMSADSENESPATEDSWTYTLSKRSGRQRSLATAGASVAIGLLGLVWWLAPTAEERPTVDPAGVAARTSDDAAKLDSHGFYERAMGLVKRYDRKGNIDRAITDFQRASALDETSAPALAGLAWAYWLDSYAGSLDQLRLEQASAAARRAAELDEFLALARVTLGMVHLDMGRAQDATRELEHALLLEPLNADAHFGLSRVNDFQGELAAAEAQIRQATESPGASWYHHTWLGDLHIKTGRYEEAEAAFKRGLELAPGNFLIFRDLGVTLYMQGKLAEAASRCTGARFLGQLFGCIHAASASPA